MIVVGIDIGLSGAFAVVMDSQILALEDLPTREKPSSKAFVRREIDCKQLGFLLRTRLGARIDEAIVVMENVRGLRLGNDAESQGSSSIFAFGETKGRICGVLETLLGVEPKLIEPQTWKRWFGIQKDKTGRIAVQKATDIFGLDDRISLVKHHNRAEALLLGRYGWQKFA